MKPQIVGSFVVLIALAAWAWTRPNPSMQGGLLSVTPGDTIDVGIVETPSSVRVHFELRNSADVEMLVLGVQPNCACLEVTLSHERAAPGDSIDLEALVGVEHQGPIDGAVSVQVAFPGAEPRMIEQQLFIRGVGAVPRPQLIVDPIVVDLGDISEGDVIPFGIAIERSGENVPDALTVSPEVELVSGSWVGANGSFELRFRPLLDNVPYGSFRRTVEFESGNLSATCELVGRHVPLAPTMLGLGECEHAFLAEDDSEQTHVFRFESPIQSLIKGAEGWLAGVDVVDGGYGLLVRYGGHEGIRAVQNVDVQTRIGVVRVRVVAFRRSKPIRGRDRMLPVGLRTLQQSGQRSRAMRKPKLAKPSSGFQAPR